MAIQGMTPLVLNTSPPPHAKKMYKLVALVDGVATSVFDGTTQYHPFVTVYQDAKPDHQGGLYVYPTMENCLRTNMRHFPGSSQLGNMQKAIAVVLAWNDGVMELPVMYGAKRAYSYVQLLDLLPMPPTFGLLNPTPYQMPTSGQRSLQQRSITRAQARTLQLEVEVQDMERRLEFARLVLGLSANSRG
ncbi:hypothetical protein VOLCADRAFT_108014 [Volvox carteri f. nagariensis]|uniref:Uncharacterized protein n=1 Tax=Volvox carteri f. nagariensis TaxID=3068 RepID=D8UHR2_VOLCA|nr:uncharacterized protein VOLCADRAFT_108014 [Volvox carteri f. nagariensis]EFJ40723.1 hypothetical protein VOLCADRAFT_108014 [Volvox carteri f. nagariensis]|eukprot:XP_002958189.1 hypothetical protein VOLCADRAFT_108014 [Volvox carteri f. nagariensis]